MAITPAALATLPYYYSNALPCGFSAYGGDIQCYDLSEYYYIPFMTNYNDHAQYYMNNMNFADNYSFDIGSYDYSPIFQAGAERTVRMAETKNATETINRSFRKIDDAKNSNNSHINNNEQLSEADKTRLGEINEELDAKKAELEELKNRGTEDSDNPITPADAWKEAAKIEREINDLIKEAKDIIRLAGEQAGSSSGTGDGGAASGTGDGGAASGAGDRGAGDEGSSGDDDD